MFDESGKQSIHCVNIKNKMNRIIKDLLITNPMSQVSILQTLEFPLNHLIIYVFNSAKKYAAMIYLFLFHLKSLTFR